MPRIHSELVFTVKDRCRVCYTCVRECPVKAIKIINGQAEVVASRCIGCGNCTRVCSQNAKVFLDTSEDAAKVLESGSVKVACLAPSFPAEFAEFSDYRVLVGMLKKLGFDYVIEVAFGADLVAHEYEKNLQDENGAHEISSDCPAVVYYVKYYYPDLVASLTPIVSPMVAASRVARDLYGSDSKTVFIGPCVAKKAESAELDVVLTFMEIRKLFIRYGITPENSEPADFDGPPGNRAAIFPVTRGKFLSVKKSDDICEENIFVASGKINFREAIKEFREDPLATRHLELLCCEGCIMGPGMTSEENHFSKTANIRNYVKDKLEKIDLAEWEKSFNYYKNFDFSRTFAADDRRNPHPSDLEIESVLKQIGKYSPEDQLNCGACGYESCREHAMAIIVGLAESEMCLPFTIDKLHNYIDELNLTNEKLASAQQSLIDSEKLATMGQLSAGIAHELNNPLGIITMYSNILLEDHKWNDQIGKDLKLIAEQAERCKKIVGGLLNFARKNQINYSTVNIEDFVKHSIRSLIIPDKVKVIFNSGLSDKMADIDPDQWMQVLVNVEKNAIEALPAEGGTLNISLSQMDDDIIFSFDDNGTGISRENMDKLFTPFFTTKPIGKGTGLGLSLIYGIIKMHRGHVSVNSNNDPDKGQTGTTFKIKIPGRRQ